MGEAARALCICVVLGPPGESRSRPQKHSRLAIPEMSMGMQGNIFVAGLVNFPCSCSA
jgi:hypothetical protein